jgi:TolB-like protein
MIKFDLIRSIVCLMMISFFQIQTTFAQKLDTTATVAVVPFNMGFKNTKDDKDYSRIIAESVLTAIEQSKRFKLIDRTDFSVIRKELKLQDEYNAEFKDEDFVRYGREKLRANFIVTGNISNVDATTHLVTGTYVGTIGFTIKVINVSTALVPVTETFKVSTGLIKTISSRDEAISAAITNMSEPIKKFVDKYFPIYAKYLRTDETSKNGEMTKVVINKGSNEGFRRSQRLIVVIYENDSVQLPPKDVGEAEIVEVQPTYSIVRIKSTKEMLETRPDKLKVLYFRSKSN